jgi:hypothetical protein
MTFPTGPTADNLTCGCPPKTPRSSYSDPAGLTGSSFGPQAVAASAKHEEIQHQADKTATRGPGPSGATTPIRTRRPCVPDRLVARALLRRTQIGHGAGSREALQVGKYTTGVSSALDKSPMRRLAAARKVPRRRNATVPIIVTWYPPGAGIGRHADDSWFGEPIAGLSLNSDCVFRGLGPSECGGSDSVAQSLAARFLYVIRGAERSDWKHEIPRRTVRADRGPSRFAYSPQRRTRRSRPTLPNASIGGQRSPDMRVNFPPQGPARAR